MVVLGGITHSAAPMPVSSWAADLDSTATGSLVVFAADTLGRPLNEVAIDVHYPDWYALVMHADPHWFGWTDSMGWARLSGIPVGRYETRFCVYQHEILYRDAHIATEKVDTIRVVLPFTSRWPVGGLPCGLWREGAKLLEAVK